MCSILVLRAMGSTSRVELAQTTRSLESSHSQPLGQNPRAVLDRSRSRVTLVRLFMLLSLVLVSCCVHQGVRIVWGFLFSPYQFSPLSLTSSILVRNLTLDTFIVSWMCFYFLRISSLLVGKFQRCINWFHFPDWAASLIPSFQPQFVRQHIRLRF